MEAALACEDCAEVRVAGKMNPAHEGPAVRGNRDRLAVAPLVGVRVIVRVGIEQNRSFRDSVHDKRTEFLEIGLQIDLGALDDDLGVVFLSGDGSAGVGHALDRGNEMTADLLQMHLRDFQVDRGQGPILHAFRAGRRNGLAVEQIVGPFVDDRSADSVVVLRIDPELIHAVVGLALDHITGKAIHLLLAVVEHDVGGILQEGSDGFLVARQVSEKCTAPHGIEDPCPAGFILGLEDCDEMGLIAPGLLAIQVLVARKDAAIHLPASAFTILYPVPAHDGIKSLPVQPLVYDVGRVVL